MKTTRSIVLAAVAVFAVSTLMCEGASDPPRRIPEGALTPEFSAVDVAGKSYAYTRAGGKVLVLAFLSSEKQRSQEAVEDIYEALSSIPLDKHGSLQVAFVLQDVDNKEFIASIQKETPPVVHILDDDRYRIWGKFGIIATPTVLIADAQGKVLCLKSGHAYDFAPVVKSKLFQALDIPFSVDSDDVSKVRVLANSTMSAKAKRHLQMAKSLAGKGRVIAAIEQAQIAQEIDPNIPEVALELGELLCRAGRPQEAVKCVGALSVQSLRERSRMNLALGWAYRLMGKLEEAERALQEGIQQDSTSPRLYFELGRIYQQRDESERAMQAYLQALTLIYGEDLR